MAIYNKASSKSNQLVTNKAAEVLADNYIYISHIDKSWCNSEINDEPTFWKLPCDPDSFSDTMGSHFQDSSALGRTAPVYTFSHAGPRVVQVSLTFHRELMNDMNTGISNTQLYDGEDYVDNLIRALRSIAVPKYNLKNKYIEPPIVALRLANELFIKGVVTSEIGITYKKPILYNNRYAEVSLSLTISETDPYDAESVFKNGGFRGMVSTMKSLTPTDQSRMGYWEG